MRLNQNDSKLSPRRLIIRLSSLGDLILSTTALETEAASQGVDWVVASEFAPILHGHPQILRVWEFGRSSGLLGWSSLCRQIWDEGYDEVYDLHNSLRSQIARILFFIWAIRDGRKAPRWFTFRKERTRLYGYFIFKSLWPKWFRPRAMVARFSEVMGGTGKEYPILNHLVDSERLKAQSPVSHLGGNYYCIMPGAQWPGKRWPVRHYIQLIERLNLFPVVVGGKSDRASFELVQELDALGLNYVSGVGQWSLAEVARVLSESKGYIGNDTGLAHLAEAVGVPSWVFYGPTVPDMGFGPRSKESRSFGASLWCRPCGKDGRFCFRVTKRFQCLWDLAPEQIRLNIENQSS